ncbi:glycine betaine ABC transporter substrate-binding protein [Streptomyces formicae]|uniref:Glycine betaine ABC transporter substrate-binding protein n=1 Tax=Streptomyces formicae TaxID=1616117 RepID=A0ABY3WNV7_9ACTN|nr:glycine betaine ABC transporter substrate-binding protein [Streptomyces formicae]UNM12260.1 glycine betaine ABC transporter substrate-binding protein [Streptomyces formicae]
MFLRSYASAALLLSATALSACSDPTLQRFPGNRQLAGASFTVGSKDFSEQIILGQMTIQLLRANGADVTDRTDIKGSSSTRNALESGDISMYWEYTGTGWVTHLKKTKPAPDQREQFDTVAKADLEKNEIVWLNPASFNNTYAFAVRKDTAQRLGVKSLSDLSELSMSRPREATFCMESEFSTRDDGFPGVIEKYGFTSPEVKILDTGLIYTETAKGKTCNFGEVFSTDGRIQANGLVLLEDDKDFFPAYQPSLTMKEETVNKYPQLRTMFTPLADSLTTDVMRELNARADVNGEDPHDIAESWLKKNGFLW